MSGKTGLQRLRAPGSGASSMGVRGWRLEVDRQRFRVKQGFIGLRVWGFTGFRAYRVYRVYRAYRLIGLIGLRV